MYRDLSYIPKQRTHNWVVVERSVYWRRNIGKYFGEIRIENAGMSNDKYYYEIVSPKVQGFMGQDKPPMVSRPLRFQAKALIDGNLL